MHPLHFALYIYAHADRGIINRTSILLLLSTFVMHGRNASDQPILKDPMITVALVTIVIVLQIENNIRILDLRLQYGKVYNIIVMMRVF